MQIRIRFLCVRIHIDQIESKLPNKKSNEPELYRASPQGWTIAGYQRRSTCHWSVILNLFTIDCQNTPIKETIKTPVKCFARELLWRDKGKWLSMHCSKLARFQLASSMGLKCASAVLADKSVFLHLIISSNIQMQPNQARKTAQKWCFQNSLFSSFQVWQKVNKLVLNGQEWG